MRRDLRSSRLVAVSIVSILSGLVAAAGCVPPRTSAATAPTVAPFDPARSDPTALQVADAAMAAVGGHDHWTGLQEVRFEVQYTIGGQRQGLFQHHWDRWNGREEFLAADSRSLGRPQGVPVAWLDVRYDLFDDNRVPFASYQGVDFDDDSARQYAAMARQRLDEDTALFLLVHRLRDPGVHLADGGEITGIEGAPDLCKPSCTSIQVTFDPGAGQGTWLLEINGATHRPEVVAKQIPAGRVAYRIDGWTHAGGLEFPTRLTNVRIANEVFEYSGVTVGAPQAASYELPVRHPDSAPTEHHTGKFDPQTFGWGRPPYCEHAC